MTTMIMTIVMIIKISMRIMITKMMIIRKMMVMTLSLSKLRLPRRQLRRGKVCKIRLQLQWGSELGNKYKVSQISGSSVYCARFKFALVLKNDDDDSII